MLGRGFLRIRLQARLCPEDRGRLGHHPRLEHDETWGILNAKVFRCAQDDSALLNLDYAFACGRLDLIDPGLHLASEIVE